MKNIRSSIFSLLGIVLITIFSTVPAFAASDAGAPGNVENLKAQAHDGAVALTWDAATDDKAVTGYQVHYGKSSVKQQGEEYDESVDVGNVLEYVVTDLENDTKYYFSVIATDADGNESPRWAKEQSVTPSKDAGDYSDEVSPKVVSAEALNKEQVKVVFSEEVVIPKEDPKDAFRIEDDDNLESLDVLDAVMDEEDKTNKTVILTTVEQTAGSTYKLTVGIDVEDKAGNPINSGTSDTAIFEGSGEDKPAEDTQGPQVVSVESIDNTNIAVNFNEVVVLGIDPSEHFRIAQEDDATKTLTVLGVELTKNKSGLDDAAALIKTSPQEDVKYILTVSDLPDEAGNDIDATYGSAMFQGVEAEASDGDSDGDIEGDTVEDKKAPKDVTNFIAKSVQEAGKYIVTLTWKLIEENAGDTTEQTLYLSNDKGEKYNKKSSLDPQADKYEVKDMEAGEYWLKLTQKDATGNESEGVVAKVVLAETGPEMLGLLVLSIGLGRFISKRKSKKQ